MKYGTEPLGKINELDNIYWGRKGRFFLYKKKVNLFIG